MKKRNTPQKSSRRNKYLASLVVLIIVLAVGGFFLKQHHEKNKDIGTTSSGGYVNLSPPTEDDLKDNDANKKALGESLDSKNDDGSDTDTTKKTSIVVTSADKNEVRAYIQGVVEDGGTCTATFTKGSSTVTKTSSGFSNVSYTTCQPIELNGALSPGKWTLEVSYTSATTTKVISASQEVEVE